MAVNPSNDLNFPSNYLLISTVNCIYGHINLILGKPHPLSSSKIHLHLKDVVQFSHPWKYIPQSSKIFNQTWSFLKCPY